MPDAIPPGTLPPGSTRPRSGRRSEEAKNQENQEKAPSRFFQALNGLFTLFAVAVFLGTSVAFVFTLDFLDVLQFRYVVPPAYRGTWPLSKYYDFVRFHQLPTEERYQQLILEQRKQFDEIITHNSLDLEQRARKLEETYTELVKSQEERFKKRQEELRALQEEVLKEKQRATALKEDLEMRKEAVDQLTRQLASEAMSLESSMIRFMEEENRMRPVQDIAATMDPKAMAGIFDEVADNQLIYDILRGVPPERSGLILANMDPEKAGKILKIAQNPLRLPPPGPSRSFIPPGLQDLMASTQNTLRDD